MSGMIAVRPLVDGKPTDVVVLPSYRARVMLDEGSAVPANGPEVTPTIPEGLPQIDPAAVVHGLTDRDPEFFERQAAENKEKEQRAAFDRMQRGGRNKGGR